MAGCVASGGVLNSTRSATLPLGVAADNVADAVAVSTVAAELASAAGSVGSVASG